MNEQDTMLADYFMGEAAAQPANEVLKRRAARVAQLRTPKLSQGMQLEGARGIPGHYVAPTAFDAIGNIAQQFGNKYQEDQMDVEQKGAGDERQRRLRELFAKYRAGQPQAPSSQGTNWAGEPYVGGFGDER